MKKAVMYGAGNIGRGFIGKVLSESGYQVCFLDIMPEIIEAFNERHEYNVKIVSNEGERVDVVKNVYAVDANTPEAVDEIAQCDLMATAVGVNILKYIVPNLVAGIRKRMQNGKGPLDIILAENQLNADQIMRDYIYEHLTDAEKQWADDNLGLVEASIGRMVPKLAPEERMGDPLMIAVEEYALLPVDSAAFKGDIPALVGLVPYTPFGFYIKRKLFIHNMGHALCAYFGWEKGCELIWQAAELPEIHDRAKRSMTIVAQALNKEYGVPLEDLEEHVEDLLYRFQNKALKDTVARVGGDPVRKLRRDDRLVGAALYALDSGFEPDTIVEGIVSALHFNNPEDEAALRLQDDLDKKGIVYAVEEYMGLKRDELLAQMIIREYERRGGAGK